MHLVTLCLVDITGRPTFFFLKGSRETVDLGEKGRGRLRGTERESQGQDVLYERRIKRKKEGKKGGRTTFESHYYCGHTLDLIGKSRK